MSDFPIPEAALVHHLAILGKTGAGKTSTEKLIVEHVAEEGFRVCILDAIKSDWFGITSSADGRRPGLPFKILGGPRGHVPLHSSAGAAIGRLVGSGQLPLSIIDMADFEAGGLQRFFVDFAEALMRSARGVLYLVIEEAHEFAPKERAGIGAESMAIHWAKKLATAGRSKGIRLIVATQRVQALHNAVLGSCETMIAHRLTAPADQDPVLKWLKANADKATLDAVSSTLSSLPTGTGWVCSGEARVFEQVAFPKFATFDNTATPTGDGDEMTFETAAVDQDELRAIIGDAVAEAEANDPKTLKAEIERLNREFAQIRNSGAAPDSRALAEAEERGYRRGLSEGERLEWRRAMEVAKHRINAGISELMDALANERQEQVARSSPAPAAPRRAARASTAVQPARPGPTADVHLSGPQQRVLNALAWWRVFGIDQPTSEQVAFVAGYSASSSGFANLKGAMRSAGLIEYPAGGRVSLTDAGAALAWAPSDEVSVEAFHRQVRVKLSAPQLRLLDPLIAAYPDPLTSAALAAAADYSPTSSGFANLRGQMRTLGFLDYPAPGHVRAADWLFPGGAP